MTVQPKRPSFVVSLLICHYVKCTQKRTVTWSNILFKFDSKQWPQIISVTDVPVFFFFLETIATYERIHSYTHYLFARFIHNFKQRHERMTLSQSYIVQNYFLPIRSLSSHHHIKIIFISSSFSSFWTEHPLILNLISCSHFNFRVERVNQPAHYHFYLYKLWPNGIV